MNKLIASILITTTVIATAIILSPGQVYAKTDGESRTLIAQEGQETQTPEYQRPIIPRPRTLPGPDGDARQALTQTILPNLAVNLVGFVSMAALLWLIIAGVRFATAYGNEEKVESAKKQVIYAIAGLIIALLAYSIVTIIVNLQIIGSDLPEETPTPQEDQIEQPDLD